MRHTDPAQTPPPKAYAAPAPLYAGGGWVSPAPFAHGAAGNMAEPVEPRGGRPAQFAAPGAVAAPPTPASSQGPSYYGAPAPRGMSPQFAATVAADNTANTTRVNYFASRATPAVQLPTMGTAYARLSDGTEITRQYQQTADSPETIAARKEAAAAGREAGLATYAGMLAPRVDPQAAFLNSRTHLNEANAAAIPALTQSTVDWNAARANDLALRGPAEVNHLNEESAALTTNAASNQVRAAADGRLKDAQGNAIALKAPAEVNHINAQTMDTTGHAYHEQYLLPSQIAANTSKSDAAYYKANELRDPKDVPQEPAPSCLTAGSSAQSISRQ